MTTPQTVKTSYVKSKDVTYAYRKIGKPNGGLPLLLLHHFRAPMDFWDPLFVSSLAAQREVILFDNAGVGKSSGEVPDSIKGMTAHVVDFLAALNLSQIDVYGFSMGGFIAQQLALDHPSLVHKVVLSGTGPGVGSEDPNIPSPNDARVGEIATGEKPNLEAMTTLFFYPTDTSRAAAAKYWDRVHERTKETSGEERSAFVLGAGLMAQVTALGKWKGGEGSYGQLHEIKCPVLITNGKDDFMVPTPGSYAMWNQIPNAQLILYPDSGHGHCFQFAVEHTQHVGIFLEGSLS